MASDIYMYVCIYVCMFIHTCMYNGRKLVTCPPLAGLKSRKAEHITQYKIRPLNTRERESGCWVGSKQSAALIRKQMVIHGGNAT